MKPEFALTKEDQLKFWKSVIVTPDHKFRKTFSKKYTPEMINEYCQGWIDKIEKDETVY